ncbi:MAG TPA: HIT family protein [Gaiellaceae bacterium]|nr:HIT family protein [Gaiellaceae bacterium]
MGSPEEAVSGISNEGPQGELGGSIWESPERWEPLADGSGCPICMRGEPLGVLLARPFSWICSDEMAITRGYFCVVARRHVVEPFELEGEERAGFWDDVLFAGQRLARATNAQKINYELHGNTLPHLHAHVYARYRGDRFVGGPVDNRAAPIANVPLDELRRALS